MSIGFSTDQLQSFLRICNSSDGRKLFASTRAFLGEHGKAMEYVRGVVFIIYLSGTHWSWWGCFKGMQSNNVGYFIAGGCVGWQWRRFMGVGRGMEAKAYLYVWRWAKTIENETKFVRDMQDCHISYSVAGCQAVVFCCTNVQCCHVFLLLLGVILLKYIVLLMCWQWRHLHSYLETMFLSLNWPIHSHAFCLMLPSSVGQQLKARAQ